VLSAVVVVELTAGAPDGARDQASHAKGCVRSQEGQIIVGVFQVLFGSLDRSLRYSRGVALYKQQAAHSSYSGLQNFYLRVGFPTACKKGRRLHSIDCGCLVDFAEQYSSNPVLP